MFESAVDATVRGDAATLSEMLRTNPGLVAERSARPHAATLLHYTAANGVEDERQTTPPNIVPIARMLLEAGAEADAVAGIYGGSTTLSLAASSVHPQRAGVQIALLQLLLDRGAAIDGAAGTANPILSALRNGRAAAAAFLAEHGARLDLESAAGTGNIDLVRTIVERHEDDAQKRTAGLAWAAQYGHAGVVEYLLDTGSDPNESIFGHTPLHWAAMGAQSEVVQLLLARGSSPQILNRYGATPLGQASWSAEHGGERSRFERTIALLSRSG